MSNCNVGRCAAESQGNVGEISECLEGGRSES